MHKIECASSPVPPQEARFCLRRKRAKVSEQEPLETPRVFQKGVLPMGKKVHPLSKRVPRGPSNLLGVLSVHRRGTISLRAFMDRIMAA